MIKLENVVLASPEQMEFIIEGMRNPMNSWEKSDSFYGRLPMTDIFNPLTEEAYQIGENDHSLMQRLSNAGTEHRKYMRMMLVYVRITAPLYWWKEFDTYKVGTVANSCSTMHKIAEKEFTMEDFSCEHLLDSNIYCYPLGGGWRGISPVDTLKATVELLNTARETYIRYDAVLKQNALYGINPEATRKEIKMKQKKIWWQMIQLLPSSYNQTRNVMLNYEVLANIYRQRKNHKLDEWREFCKWIGELPYSELIIDNNEKKSEDSISDWMKMVNNMVIDILLKDAENRPTLCDCSDIPAWLEEEREVLNEVFKIHSPSDYAKGQAE